MEQGKLHGRGKSWKRHDNQKKTNIRKFKCYEEVQIKSKTENIAKNTVYNLLIKITLVKPKISLLLKGFNFAIA